MKTKVRITKDCTGDTYRHLFIAFLTPCSWSDNPFSLDVVMTISFQSDTEKTYWYGMNVNISTDRVEYIEQAVKILKEIYAKCETKSPAEIIAVLNSEQYVYRNGNYLPVNMHGTNEYLIKRNGEGYKVFYAFGSNAVTKEIYKLQDSGLTGEWSHELTVEGIPLHPVSIDAI